MAVRGKDQLSLVEALVSPKLGGNAQLDRLAGLLKWYRFEKLVAELRDDGGAEHSGYPMLLLIKALLLQSLYGLSDRELEEALDDRVSFRRFVGLGLEDAVPDQTVLDRFRNRLVEQKLLDRLFDELSRQIEKAGLILKRGTMLHATLVRSVIGTSTDGPDER